MNKFVIPVKSFRRMDDPFGTRTSTKYIAYVHVKDVPEDLPMGTNPREQNLKTNVAIAIEESLQSDDGNFHLLNRGLTLSAANVDYNPKTEKMSVIFDDLYEHGDIDGGHTYKIILKNKEKGLNQYVQFEIMTKVEPIIEKLAGARNTSVQVDDKSMAELEGKFAPIKDSIGGMPFYDRVAFKQNQYNGQGKRVIDAREIVAVLTMFNIDNYSETIHPTQTYSSKASVLDKYLANQEPFEKMHNIAPDIFDLYNEIEKDFPTAYNATGGRYGLRKYSGYKGEDITVTKTKFGDESLIYKVPEGFMYPILAAFRSLVDSDIDSGMYRWKKDPFAVYKQQREQLALKTIKFAEAIGNNPNAVGKDSNIWDMLYMTVERTI